MMSRQSQPRWTRWFNIDTPNTEGDFECLSCIRQMGYNVCDKAAVLQAECKLVKTGHTFTKHTVSTIKNVLRNECTKSGLMCLNKDQPENQQCDDYAIRFGCAAVDNSVKSMYWWIGVLAAVLIIITIMWFIFFLIRKRRPSPEYSNDAVSTLAQPPPSYKDLFGLATESTNSRTRSVQEISSQSSHNLLNESEPSSVSVIGIESPTFSTDDEISRDNIDADDATVDENGSYIRTNDAIRTDGINHSRVHTSPSQPIIPWAHRSSVHRSPFPLLQPYSKIDDPPSYQEALKYLSQDWKSQSSPNARNK